MSEQTLHGGLTAERWNQFPLERRLMMIASEFARASQLVEGKGGRGDAQRCYARARELLSWTAAWLRTQPNESLAQRLEAIGLESMTTPSRWLMMAETATSVNSSSSC